MHSPFGILVRLLLGCILNICAVVLLALYLLGNGSLIAAILAGIIGATLLPSTNDVDAVLDAMRKASEP
jgi:uncharacterized membrane protein YeaQ/YmgE (transglycosylase-associated protein family)